LADRDYISLLFLSMKNRNTSVLILVLGLVCSPLAAAESVAANAPSIPSAGGWRYADIRRFPAPEARQGVAADDEFLYVISNHAIGKYRKDTGVRVAAWECPPGQPLTHLNAGIVQAGRLYCAHSNYPGVPNLSSVEIWDTATLQHVGSHSFAGPTVPSPGSTGATAVGSRASSITQARGRNPVVGQSGRAWLSLTMTGGRRVAGLFRPTSR
jgi:hypothetical protein